MESLVNLDNSNIQDIIIKGDKKQIIIHKNMVLNAFIIKRLNKIFEHKICNTNNSSIKMFKDKICMIAEKIDVYNNIWIVFSNNKERVVNIRELLFENIMISRDIMVYDLGKITVTLKINKYEFLDTDYEVIIENKH